MSWRETYLWGCFMRFSCPSCVPGEPGLFVPGMYLPPTQPQDAAALPTGNQSPSLSPLAGPLLSPPSLLADHPRSPVTYPSFLDSFQNKNGDGLPSAVTPRVQRPATTSTTTTPVLAAPSGCSSKQPVADTEASEQRALHTVQYGLLKILSRTLAALRHFTPDVCQILLDQVLIPPPDTRFSTTSLEHGLCSTLCCTPESSQQVPECCFLSFSRWISLNTTSYLP